LREGEDEELEAEFRRFSNGRKILEAVGAAHESLSEGAENASQLTGHALKELSAVSGYDDALKGMEEQLYTIDSLLNDLNREMADYLDETDFDEETFYRMEKRLDEINHLKSKYGNSITEILAALREKQSRMEKLTDYDGYLNNLREQAAKAKEALESASIQVSEIRKKYANELVKAVTAALQDLNFLDVQFEMQFERTADYTANGIDDAEFLISTNPGEPLKPLGKVASGGELSRIMLAIKTVLADNDAVETLIFDEIDSGISGRTAQMVSEKMNVLGRNHQIICITHLPQIAAMADAHYLIRKSVQGQATVSTIRELSETESVEELARMLGGVEITDTVRQNAREMKKLAAGKKQP
jgi:DNA repair protein RecN (Recombination protein N)